MTDPMPKELTFQEKVALFSADYLKCCKYLMQVEPGRDTLTKRLYSLLISSSQLLEDLLDFHGAKNNRNWYYYRELSATVRHLSRAAYSQKHIFNRMPFYELESPKDFDAQGDRALAFLTRALQRLAPAILEEARRLEIPVPDGMFTPSDFPRVSTDEILESDIDDAEKQQKTDSIVGLASEFLNIVNTFDHLAFYEPLSIEQIKDLVPTKANEVQIRKYEMVVHNLQSEFDSYVIHGGYRFGNRRLKKFRSYFSIVLHLLELTGGLLHYYERHLLDAGFKNVYKQVSDRLLDLVDGDELLEVTVNYGLFYVCEFLTQGMNLAQEVLNENMQRDSITVGVPQKLGFHSRPSLMVAKVVQHYGGQVEMIVNGDRFDASSVLDMQWAGGKIKKEDVDEVVFSGDVRALHDLAILASVNYGEDSMGKGVELPKELSYLK